MARSPLVMGRLHDPSKDIYPTSGAHLDVRFKKKGSDKWENPAIARSFIGKNIGVGDNNLPLYVNDNNTWKINPAVGAMLTSPQGPRDTGIPGASTWHAGHDYSGGLLSKPGTKLSWLGNATEKRSKDSSSNTLFTTDPNSGEEYEVSFLHIDPNKSPFPGGNTTGMKPSQSPTTATATTGQANNAPVIINLKFGNPNQDQAEQNEPKDFLTRYIEGMKNTTADLVGSILASNPWNNA